MCSSDLGGMRAAGLREKDFFGAEATEKAFMAALVESDLVQVEKWMLDSPNDPLSSAIVLSPSGD